MCLCVHVTCMYFTFPKPIKGISQTNFQQNFLLNKAVFQETFSELFTSLGLLNTEISLTSSSASPSLRLDSKRLLAPEDVVYLTFQISLILGEDNPYSSPSQALQELTTSMQEATTQGTLTTILQVCGHILCYLSTASYNSVV